MRTYGNMRSDSVSTFPYAVSGRYDKLVPISKALAKALRHTTVRTMQSDGFASLDVVLNLPQLRYFGATEQDICRIVQGAGGNSKKRFDLGLLKDGVTKAIRAAQGHSRTNGIVHEDACPQVKMVGLLLHGTTWDAAQSIVHTGIYRQNRLHVHFVEYAKTASMDVVSGVRRDAELGIIIDGPRAEADNIVFYRSSNGVILSSGVHGIIPCKYILRVIDLSNNDTVYTHGDGWCWSSKRRTGSTGNDGSVRRRRAEDERHDHISNRHSSPHAKPGRSRRSAFDDVSKRSRTASASPGRSKRINCSDGFQANPDKKKQCAEDNFDDASPTRMNSNHVRANHDERERRSCENHSRANTDRRNNRNVENHFVANADESTRRRNVVLNCSSSPDRSKRKDFANIFTPSPKRHGRIHVEDPSSSSRDRSQKDFANRFSHSPDGSTRRTIGDHVVSWSDGSAMMGFENTFSHSSEERLRTNVEDLFGNSPGGSNTLNFDVNVNPSPDATARMSFENKFSPSPDEGVRKNAEDPLCSSRDRDESSTTEDHLCGSLDGKKSRNGEHEYLSSSTSDDTGPDEGHMDLPNIFGHSNDNAKSIVGDHGAHNPAESMKMDSGSKLYPTPVRDTTCDVKGNLGGSPDESTKMIVDDKFSHGPDENPRTRVGDYDARNPDGSVRMNSESKLCPAADRNTTCDVEGNLGGRREGSTKMDYDDTFSHGTDESTRRRAGYRGARNPVGSVWIYSGSKFCLTPVRDTTYDAKGNLSVSPEESTKMDYDDTFSHGPDENTRRRVGDNGVRIPNESVRMDSKSKLCPDGDTTRDLGDILRGRREESTKMELDDKFSHGPDENTRRRVGDNGVRIPNGSVRMDSESKLCPTPDGDTTCNVEGNLGGRRAESTKMELDDKFSHGPEENTRRRVADDDARNPAGSMRMGSESKLCPTPDRDTTWNVEGNLGGRRAESTTMELDDKFSHGPEENTRRRVGEDGARNPAGSMRMGSGTTLCPTPEKDATCNVGGCVGGSSDGNHVINLDLDETSSPSPSKNRMKTVGDHGSCNPDENTLPGLGSTLCPTSVECTRTHVKNALLDSHGQNRRPWSNADENVGTTADECLRNNAMRRCGTHPGGRTMRDADEIISRSPDESTRKTVDDHVLHNPDGSSANLGALLSGRPDGTKMADFTNSCRSAKNTWSNVRDGLGYNPDERRRNRGEHFGDRFSGCPEKSKRNISDYCGYGADTRTHLRNCVSGSPEHHVGDSYRNDRWNLESKCVPKPSSISYQQNKRIILENACKSKPISIVTRSAIPDNSKDCVNVQVEAPPSRKPLVVRRYITSKAGTSTVTER